MSMKLLSQSLWNLFLVTGTRCLISRFPNIWIFPGTLHRTILVHRGYYHQPKSCMPNPRGWRVDYLGQGGVEVGSAGEVGSAAPTDSTTRRVLSLAATTKTYDGH